MNKYIKLFEAFDSNILSKTIRYISNKDKNIFLEQIREICDILDFPLSKFSDDFFQYLPFNKALKLASETGDEPCEATSTQQFHGYGIEGEKCQNGRIKRKWGSRIRSVACSVCGGTGVKPKKPELKLLKFWFTSEGKYVATTAVDGNVLNKSKEFSKETSDYQSGPALKLSDLKGGEIVKIRLKETYNNNYHDTIAYIFKDNNDNFWAIQDKIEYRNGHYVPLGPFLSKFGSRSFLLRDNFKDIRLAIKRSTEQPNPYDWNFACDIRRNFNIIKKNVEELIIDANFAIVLDFGKLKKSDFIKFSDIKKLREIAKKGSKLDPKMSNEEIKKINIERYINTISNNLNITNDISNCNKLIRRSLGGKHNAIFVIFSTQIFRSFERIINDYLNIMSETSEDVKKIYINDISDINKNLYRNSNEVKFNSTKALNELREIFITSEQNYNYTEAIDKLLEISEVVYDAINKNKIECIEDFEVAFQKILMIRSIISSNRYEVSRFFSYAVEYIANGRTERAKQNIFSYDKDELVKNLERLRLIISKM